MKLFKIGSNSKCDIVLNSPYVSGLHAELTSLPEGNFILEDKNSTNGTTVNGKKIEGAKEITVVRGDKIVFGDTPLMPFLSMKNSLIAKRFSTSAPTSVTSFRLPIPM